MSHRRSYVLALAGLIFGLSGVLSNVASGLLPPAWQAVAGLATVRRPGAGRRRPGRVATPRRASRRAAPLDRITITHKSNFDF